MDDLLVMEIEREQAIREYQAMRRQQDALHAATCPAEIHEQSRAIVDAIMPQKI